ncbi:MAG: nucleotide exchange factor GrpE [Dermatophilaceae bacterium]
MTDIDGATTPGAAGAASDGEDSGAASDGRQHRPADASPSPAQAAAAKAAYQDVQASTGGQSKIPQAADPLEETEEPPTEWASDGPGDRQDVEAPESADPNEPAQEDVMSDSLGGSDAQLAAERLADLQRLQAEYVNYKRRVDRDRALESERAIASMVESLLPVLDEVQLAREHGELGDGPFAKIAEKLETTLARYGVVRYGEPGETFDPTVHEAVMHTHAELAPGTTATTVVQVLQPGYKIGDRVLRAALVAVADPL